MLYKMLVNIVDQEMARCRETGVEWIELPKFWVFVKFELLP